ncbi:cupredoxin domain-containing protein [Microvirga terricola]|uniref:Cupredoxin family copper-binding protein n=1 Tax=Microvirga terricola TaxID=2719797 RepID=A0ABX0V8W6_9HYPH|nr:cupredoxin family copper-binding protein [Microvirga terricola]
MARTETWRVAFLLVPLLAGAAAFAVDAPTNEVKIENFTFAPEAITVLAGTKVTWVNRDDIPHTVTAQDHSFRSKALDTNDSFSFTFEKPGEYAYFCSIHPKMVGKIIVKAP